MPAGRASGQMFQMQASSSIGRATVSKTVGWGFETLLACHTVRKGSAIAASMKDRIKFALGAVLVLAGLGAYYYLSESALVIRVVALLVGIAAGAALAWSTAPGQDFRGFAVESYAEATRVSWPTAKETRTTTLVVFVLVVLMGLFLWLVDYGIVRVVSLLMGRSE